MKAPLNFAVRSSQFAIIFLLMQVITKPSFAQSQINYSPVLNLLVPYTDEKVFNADINHDGNLDIILYKSSSGLVTALKHNGNNNANGMQFGNPFSVSITSESLIDVKNINDNNVNNTDQEADLITYKAGVTYDQIYYYKSDGFSFSSGLLISNNSLPHANYQFGTFDMDNDGDFDIYALDKANSLFYYGIVSNLTVIFSPALTIPAIPANATVHIFSGHFCFDPLNVNTIDLCYVVETPNGNTSDYYFQVLKNNNGTSLSLDFNISDNNVSPNRQFFAGKFTTDIFSDIAMYAPGSANANIPGYIDVLSNVAGTMFAVSQNNWQDGLTPPNNASFLVDAGNYSSYNSYDDMLLLETSATAVPTDIGNSYLDINTGNNISFTLSQLGIAPCNTNPIGPNQSSDFHVVPGDFDIDGITDIVLYNPTDHILNVGILMSPTLQGYCWPQSAAPNESINFFISGTATSGTINFYQYESRDNTIIETLWASAPITITSQSTNSNAVQNGCGWNSTYSFNIPGNWPSGYYAAKVSSNFCNNASINFIVKADPNNQSTKKLLLLANTNTWAAYNTYTNSNQPGSKYGDGNVSKYQDYSFMRPSSNNNIYSNENTHLARAELWIYTWLKDNGYDPDVISDMDLHLNIGNINSYDYLVMGTHPEYWTGMMYDHVKDFQANGAGGKGGNLICLGGNAVFEVVDIDLSNAANPRLIAYPNNPAGPVTPNTVSQQNAQYPFQYQGQLLVDQVGGLLASSPFISGGDYYHDRFDYFLESYNFGAPGGPVVNKRSIDLIGTHYMNLASLGVSNTSYTKTLNLISPLFNGIANTVIGINGYNSHDGVRPLGDGSAAGWECDRYTEAAAPLNFPLTPASPVTNPNSIYYNDIQVLASSTHTPASDPVFTQGTFFPNGMNNSEIIYVRPTCTAPNKHGFVFTAGSICFGGSLVWNYDNQNNVYNNDLSRLLINVLEQTEFTASITNVTCNGGNTGSIIITQPALYAANSITYGLSGNGTNTTGIFTNLAAGTYQLTISIPNGNLPITLCREYTVTEPAVLNLNATANDPICNGANGQLTFSASGGTGNITITINGIAQNSPYPAPAGTYTIVAMDANNCTASTTIAIIQPTQVTVTASAGAIACNGGSSTITASGSGGTPAYEYSLNGGTFQAGANFFGNLAGTYTITVKDANNCTASTTISILQPTVVAWNIVSFTNILCNPNGTDGTITVEVTGGMSPFSYLINPNIGTQLTPGHFASLTANSYTITATDANGCSITTSLELLNPNTGNFCCSFAAAAIVVTPNVILKIAPTASNLVAQYGNVISNKTFYIDDIFTIDHDITFNNCTLWFTPTGNIQLQGPYTLDVNTSTLQASCDWWGGIVANAPQQKVVVENGSHLKNAIVGINISGNAVLEASDSYFEDNGILSIQFSGLTSIGYPGYVVRNTFTSGNALPLPYTKTERAIQISDVKQINIGDITDANSGNIFDGMQCGIFVSDANTNGVANIGLYNNKFTNIHATIPVGINQVEQYLVNSCYTACWGAGIYANYAWNANQLNNIGTIKIGHTNTISGTTFEACDKAIVTVGPHLIVENEYAKNCLLGLMCHSPFKRDFILQHNKVDNAHIGIQLFGIPKTCNIESNIISVDKVVTTFSGPPGGQVLVYAVPVGIKVQYGDVMQAAPVSFIINDNTVEVKSKAGVGIYNAYGDMRLQTKGNTVSFTTNNSGDVYFYNIKTLMGLWAAKCSESDFDDNNTHGFNNPTLYDARNSYGMYMDNSPWCRWSCNKANYIRYGFYIWGNNETKKEKVTHNRMDFNEFPWYFLDGAAAQAGTFGTIGNPNAGGIEPANEYFNVAGIGSLNFNPNLYKVYRNSTLITPYQIATDNSFLLQGESGALGANAEYGVGPNLNSYSNPCTNFNIGNPNNGGDDGTYDEYMQDVVDDSIAYINYDEVASWMDRYKVYRQLDIDSLLRSSDVALESFYNLHAMQNIGKLRDAERAINLLYDSTTNASNLTDRYNAALLANESMLSGEDWEMNEKAINHALILLSIMPADSLPQNVKDDIGTIAHLCPYVGGNGVLKARNLWMHWQPNALWDDRVLCMPGQNKNQNNSDIDIDSMYVITIKEMMVNYTNTNVLNNNIKPISSNKLKDPIQLYPNPASNYVEISYTSKLDGEFVLYNTIGDVILKASLPKEYVKRKIQLNDIVSGLYHYEIHFLDGDKQFGKLSIVR